VQSIEYLFVEEAIPPKALLSLEIRVNSVDHVALPLAPVSTGRSLNPIGDYIVATATATPSKSTFVEEFLRKNPQGNVQAVNEAWAEAGMKGTIGDTLIYGMRKQMGLTGKSKPQTAAKAKSGNKMPKPVLNPGKRMFVKEFLNDHPEGNFAAVNEAWRAAGFDGTISKTVVDKMRAAMGLTGNLRRRTKTSKTSKKRGRPRKETATAAVSVQPRSSNGDRTVVLNDLEAGIDRLLFRVMAIGDLTEIEDSLRQTRRLLYGALTRG
jgi:hypothetical protein